MGAFLCILLFVHGLLFTQKPCVTKQEVSSCILLFLQCFLFKPSSSPSLATLNPSRQHIYVKLSTTGPMPSEGCPRISAPAAPNRLFTTASLVLGQPSDGIGPVVESFTYTCYRLGLVKSGSGFDCGLHRDFLESFSSMIILFEFLRCNPTPHQLGHSTREAQAFFRRLFKALSRAISHMPAALSPMPCKADPQDARDGVCCACGSRVLHVRHVGNRMD